MLRHDLRRVAMLMGMLVLLAATGRAEGSMTAGQVSVAHAGTGSDELPAHVIDQTDPAQYDEVSAWAMDWRALPRYVRALVVLAGVLLLSCGSVVAAFLWGLRRAYARLVYARQRLARAQRWEAALDAAMQRMEEHRRVQRELRRVP